MTPLDGQNAIVTGGARGIGLSYALRLADCGANVAVADIDLRAFERFDAEAERITAESVEEELESLGVEALGIRTDVTDRDDVEEMVDQVASEWESIDILVANAGGETGGFKETAASRLGNEHLTSTIELNLYGTINTCVAVAERMKRQESGTIITVGSQAGRMPRQDGCFAHYGVAKAAVIMYTKYLAQDLGPYGITANVIAPGAVRTAGLEAQYEDGDAESLDYLAEGTALGRIGEMEDCADVLEFLAGPKSDYLTGAVLPVDGGATHLG